MNFFDPRITQWVPPSRINPNGHKVEAQKRPPCLRASTTTDISPHKTEPLLSMLVSSFPDSLLTKPLSHPLFRSLPDHPQGNFIHNATDAAPRALGSWISSLKHLEYGSGGKGERCCSSVLERGFWGGGLILLIV